MEVYLFLEMILIWKKSNLYGKIKVNEISGNLINNISLYPNNSTFIFNISSNDIFDFIFHGLITIEHNIYCNNDLNNLNYVFYCLSILNGDFENGKWNCIERKKNEDQKFFFI